jgi:MSHA biogenesis protein MshM
MYLEHFGLSETPFRLTPDTGFFCNYASYQEALNVLLIALSTGEGFIKITGEVGTGKTLLCRKLLNTLGDQYVTLYIPNPYLFPTGLLMAVAEELGLTVDRYDGMYLLFKRITHKLMELKRSGKNVVLCLDEVQATPDSSLECVRLLTNLETEKQKLLQVVMFGQPELDQRLSKHVYRQLKQRITFSYHLAPLNRYSVDAYINHRLHTAGYTGKRLFSYSAIRLLHRNSRGIPRLVNVLGHKALMAAYGQGEKQIKRHHVRQAVHDTESIQPFAPRSRLRLAYGSFIVLLVVSTVVGSYYLARHLTTASADHIVAQAQ